MLNGFYILTDDFHRTKRKTFGLSISLSVRQNIRFSNIWFFRIISIICQKYTMCWQ